VTILSPVKDKTIVGTMERPATFTQATGCGLLGGVGSFFSLGMAWFALAALQILLGVLLPFFFSYVTLMTNANATTCKLPRF
jgi:Na+/pantothenate symporter